MGALQDLRYFRKRRAAEGYLDLLMAYLDRWPPEPAIRDRLAQRALDELEGLPKRKRWRVERAYLRGQAFRLMERHWDAIEALREAADLQPGDLHIQLALGWCFKRVRHLDLAIQALEEAMESHPDEAILHYNLACYWSLARNKGLALQYLAQSFDLDPKYRDLVPSERDFDDLRDDPDFQMLTAVVV